MLLFLCCVCFLFQEAWTTDVFVEKESATCLLCPSKDIIKDVIWFGPPNDMVYISGSQVDAQYLEIYLNTTTGKSALCINSVTMSYEGKYSCHGLNQSIKTHYNVILTVKPTKMVIENNHLGSLNISEDRKTNLSCSIRKGKPAGDLRWIFKDEILMWDKEDRISYVITPTSSDNGKVYTCQALDFEGNPVLEEQVKINVFGRPVTPSLLESVVMATSVIIKWHPMYDGGYPQTFVVQYRRYIDTSDNETWQNITVSDSGQNHVDLQNLSPNTYYLVRIYAFNEINRSKDSGEIMVSTSQSRSVINENPDSYQSGYYALVVLPVLLVIIVIVYFIRGNRLPISIKRFWVAAPDDNQEQNVVDVGPGAVGNDLYGQANIPPPSRQNDEVQVYSSFDRRHNITLSTHAQSASYDVRPKQKPNNGRNKQKAAKEKRPTNDAQQIEGSQNAQQLNYVEVSFDTQRSGNRVKIHGKKQPSTDYVDIDFTKKFIAPPVQANHADSDDDFESEYEIKKMKRRTKLQEK